MNNHVEAKLITYLSEREVGEDIHIVKEVSYADGKYQDEVKVIKDFKRPFWVTKEAYRKTTDKKEAEDLNKVDKFMTTQSSLFKTVSSKLGSKYIGITDPRRLKSDPYLYGVDVDSRTILKKMYNNKYNNFSSPYRVGVFDIEVNMLTSEMIILSIVTKDELVTTLLKSYADTVSNLEERVIAGYRKYIPDTKFKEDLDITIKVFKTEIEMIRYAFQKANYMNVDILTAWNAKFDITEILDRIEEVNEDPADIFHYDKIDSKYKFFKFKEGQTVRKTEAGREMALSPEDQWHNVKSSSNYAIIDAMAAHRFIRVGGATMPGGYSLDNILKSEKVHAKLKFKNDIDDGVKGVEWHIHMVEKRPLEYIIYNMWDCMSMIELDVKTKDLSTSLPLLSVESHFDIFNSGPKKLIDSLFFFYLENKKVLGCRDPKEPNDKVLGLDGWVITLNSYMIEHNGMRIIKEDPNMVTNIRSHTSDLDITSAYPNAGRICNVSKDTTHRELVSIKGIPKETFKLMNINSMFGNTNSLEYSQVMYNLPSLFTLYKNLVKKK